MLNGMVGDHDAGLELVPDRVVSRESTLDRCRTAQLGGGQSPTHTVLTESLRQIPDRQIAKFGLANFEIV